MPGQAGLPAAELMPAPLPPCQFARHGVLLHLSGVLPDGRPMSVHWKAFASGQVDGEVTLKWEVTWLLQSVGFQETPKQKYWRIIGDNWRRWRADLLIVGIDADMHMCESRNCLSHRLRSQGQQVGQPVPDVAFELAEQEHWVSTQALVCLLSFWPIRRRSLAIREQVTSVGGMFLGQTLGHSELQPLLDMHIPEGAKSVCEHTGDGSHVCDCLQAALLHSAAPSLAKLFPHEFVHQKLLLLARTCPCAGATAWLRSLIFEVASRIDASVALWGDSKWHKSDLARLSGQSGQASAAKRRRADFHVKQVALVSSLQSGKATSTGQSVRALEDVDSAKGIRWRQVEMAAYRSSTVMSFGGSLSFGVAIDATRLGKPAREVLMGVITNNERQLHAVLPPQALGPCFRKREGKSRSLTRTPAIPAVDSDSPSPAPGKLARKELLGTVLGEELRQPPLKTQNKKPGPRIKRIRLRAYRMCTGDGPRPRD